MVIYYLLLLVLLLPTTMTVDGGAAVVVSPSAAAQTPSDESDFPLADDFFSYRNSTATAIFAVLLFAFLLTGFTTIYIRHCAGDDGDNRTIHRFAAASRPPRLSSSGGLNPAVIKSFPLFNYSEIKHLKIGKGAVSCAVCVSEFGDNERLRLLPKCDHAFHPECIDPWLASHSTCPICRASLIQGIEPTQSTEECNSRPELTEVQNQNQISVTVDEVYRTDTEPRERVRTFPRPHSTGHSLVGLGEDCERYTLRLPEEAGGPVRPGRDV
ncbi:E3 ubiquitin-protein ligase ATL31-like isoform X2 [Rhododendron vialii]|uniref:E3 ubiquitin-protein ligase ATL31-like isoform X2 n=1 Tax=Rhododendron vialii TaxID=182163 RepID=UPI00265DD144|nr:E3 ubiquitin-protein ligase ATL31-like isoform X2 [Rhododendron vialii]